MFIKKIFFTCIEWLIRGIPAGMGQRIRYMYYRRRFAECGENVRIDEGVVFHYPEHMVIGNDVWIMSYSVLTAAGPEKGEPSTALFRINNEVQIGLYNILNGIAGLEIGSCVTLSARVSIYSSTHIDSHPENKSIAVGANSMIRSRPVFSKQTSIKIGDGTWLAVGVVVICASIGQESFLYSGAVVLNDIADNKVYAGNPAAFIRERNPEAGL